uniref:gonadotropin subunit beta-1-like n=1 Tax=Doryrhamphus excisus TaxID=161450 RepID=UPI0025ADAEAD|nr:gonadotropin subunit beta-1-like [Doryrhamphus excisus]
MQLVVMAAVLALADARQSCSFGCKPRNVNISVESCGKMESVFTTICEGQCYHEDPVYMSWYQTKQNVCIGDWSYEVKHFKDCPVGVTYPVAKNCKCTTCNEDHTDCGRVPWVIPSCLASYLP